MFLTFSSTKDRPAQKSQFSILLIEDNPADAFLVQSRLEEAGDFQLEIAERLSQAIDYIEAKEFDVILLDLNLPDGVGLEALVKLRKHVQHLPIVVLTSINDERLAVMAVQRGAQDYLVKGTDSTRLVQSLTYAIQRINVDRLQLSEVNIDSSQSGMTVGRIEERKHHEILTEREVQVLKLLQAGCTNNEIAERLGISSTTAKSHISNILQKLAVPGRLTAVLEGIRLGLI
jgi:NarL family two-component system response regulator YdfI